MKVQDLFEMPKDWPPTEFDLDNPQVNVRTAHKLLSDKRKQAIEKFDDGVYTLYELPRSYVLIDHSDDSLPKIAYLMKYEVSRYGFIGVPCAQQIVVWSDKSHAPAIGLAAKVFFNYLLHNYKAVITDSLQTSDGKRFWYQRIQEALQRSDVYVYFVSLLAPNRKIVRIHNTNEFKHLVNNASVWGPDARHEAQRIVITTLVLNE